MSLRLLISCFVLVFMLNESHAQVSLDRQVISCFGLNHNGTMRITSATAGQVGYTTNETESGILTQGFHQPRNIPSMQVNIIVYDVECNDLYDVRILSVDGCDDMSGMVILWNNIQGGMIQKGLPANSTLVISTLSGCHYTEIFDFETYPDQVPAPCEVDFYNYISPNNDGDNDVWIIRNLDNPLVQSASVKIFNRWGALVWEGKDYDNTNVVWKGKAQSGADLPDGTYYYVATINEQVYNGYVELMR